MNKILMVAVICLSGCVRTPDPTPPEKRDGVEIQEGIGEFGFFHRFYDREEDVVCYARYSAISCVKRGHDPL